MRSFIVLMIFIFISCSPENTVFGEKNIIISKSALLANGADTCTILVQLSQFLKPEFQKANFYSSDGTFLNDFTKTESETIEVNAISNKVKEGDKDKIYFLAKTVFKASNTNKSTAEIEVFAGGHREVVKIALKSATPKKVILNTNSFSIKNNFDSEVKLTGKIFDKNNNLATRGVKAEFIDIYQNGETVQGRFREVSINSNEKSEVNAIYSLGNISGNQDIFVICSINNRNIRDTITLTIKE